MSHSNRPYVICHMMSTIEGKITGGDHTDILDNYFDLYTETEDMLPPHTGWMCGRVTMQMFADTTDDCSEKNHIGGTTGQDYIAPHDGKLVMFGVDTKGTLRWKTNTITLTNVNEPLHLVIIVTSATPHEYLAYLQSKNISYIVAGNDDIDFDILLPKIKALFGVETLLLEGGGLLNGSVMQQSYIDEISLLLTPTIVNQTDAPSVFEHTGNTPVTIRRYTVLEIKQLKKQTVWIRWIKAK